MANTHGGDIAHSDAGPSTSTASGLADDDPRIWGWHMDGDGTVSRRAGIIVALMLLSMFFGNHLGKVEDLWLFVAAAVCVLMVVISAANRRKSSWRK